MKTELKKLLAEAGLPNEKSDYMVDRISYEIGKITVPKTEYNAKVSLLY